MARLLLAEPAFVRQEAEAGYFGKLPSHGDFLSGRVPRTLRDRLDDWLQRAIAASRKDLGETWQDAFDAMPLWCFVLGQKLAEGAPVIGVVAPSRDRVGRRFPLAVLSRLDGHRSHARLLCDADDWFAAAAAILYDARQSGFGSAHLEEDTRHLPRVGRDTSESRGTDPDAGRSLWWTHRLGTGSARFAAAGLPAPNEFHRMLGRPISQPLPSPLAEPATPMANAKIEATSPVAGGLKVAITAATHAGTRWRTNADALGRIDRSNGYVLSLADGVGESASSVEAGKLIVGRLDRIGAAPTLEETIRLVRSELGRANALLRTRDQANEGDGTASVAVLAFGEAQFAAVWAGDARIYLLRDGTMRLLTRDHVEIGMLRRLSRSVGGAAQFNCDAVCDTARPGDRFLLCSRPLPQVLGERIVAETLLDARSGARRLVEDALIAGVADNVSAIVADCVSA